MGHPPGTDLFRDGSAVVTLAHVTDGDTAAFVVGGVVYPTRFLAVNTPETSHPTEGTEPWGYAAKDFTRKLLENADQIVLELDPKSDLFDRYDRLLAWVWVDGELLNYRLVEEGLAWVMYLYGDYRYNDILIAKESEVRKTRIRIHGEKDPSFDNGKAVQASQLRRREPVRRALTLRPKGWSRATIGTTLNPGGGVRFMLRGHETLEGFRVGNRFAITGLTTEV
jgi:micrococcal nuclease